MVGFITNPSIVCGIERVELTMFDHQSNTLASQHLPELILIKPFVSDDSFHDTEVSFQDLPHNLHVMW